MASALFAFLSGVAVTFWYLRRNPRPSRSSWLIVFNGSSWSMSAARVLPSGNIVDSFKAEHSIGLCARVDAPISLGVVYALPVEPVPLADHRMMEQSRKSILKGYLLKPGGDMQQLAIMAMCAFAIAAALRGSCSVVLNKPIIAWCCGGLSISGSYQVIIRFLSCVCSVCVL